MKSILERTRESLEQALSCNPASTELMASLAEVYVRLGRFDERTMELCQTVLDEQVDNALLQQAQSIRMLIEETEELERRAAREGRVPDPDALHETLESLREFLTQSPDCMGAWVAWTRIHLLLGDLDRAGKGIEDLERLGRGDLDRLFGGCFGYLEQARQADANGTIELVRLYQKMDQESRALLLLEERYDEGIGDVGPILLEFYQRLYSPGHAGQVPDEVRQRFFMVMLDHAQADTLNDWLRQAAERGWEISTFSQSYAKAMVEQDQLDEAFNVLRRMTLDRRVKQMLNELATAFEQADEVDKAVNVLRYINDNVLVEDQSPQTQENTLMLEAERTMAELQLKNGRYDEALQKYIYVLCEGAQPDPEVLEQIDGLLEHVELGDVEPLLRLGLYFRRQKDHPKAVFYLNQAVEREPDRTDVIHELETLFDEILGENPDLPQLRLELGRLYLKTGRWEKAIEELRVAAGSLTQTDEANRLLARAYLKSGHLEQSMERYRMVTVENHDCEDLYELSEAFMQTSAMREALTALDLIGRVNPDYRDVRQRISQIEENGGSLRSEIDSDPRMRELIGDLAVGRYRYSERLGSGGMGVVHKVYDIRNQRSVAMKILRDSLSSSSKALDRFFREARIAARLNHKNIVQIFDYNISNVNGQSYIVMEYVDGPSLREIIDRQFTEGFNTPIDFTSEVLYYSIQLCDALEASHDSGIIHRDIKPDNIMINSLGEVKITDFGIVHIEEATFTPTGAMVGTPRYMSPEQVTGGKIDGRADLYSVGVLLYEMLTGSPPFASGDVSYQQVHNKPLPPREINPLVPKEIAGIIMRCLEKDPDRRFNGAKDLKMELVQALDALGGCNKYGSHTATQCYDGPTDGKALQMTASLDPGPTRIPLGEFNSPAPSPPMLGSENELDLD